MTFHHWMHIDDFLRTEDFAVKAGDAMLAELNDGQKLDACQPGYSGVQRCFGHMDDIGRANDVANATAGASRQVYGFNHD